MRVLVTGASGHIGSAVVPELLGAGHQVVGLARSDSSAKALEAAGAEVHRGDLDDLDDLRKATAAADGVIHLAFKPLQSTDFMDAISTDLAAIDAIGDALEGSGKPLVSTQAILTLSFIGHITDRPATEADIMAGGPRVDAENTVIALAERGVRSSIVRLPPLVHTRLDRHGFTPSLISSARTSGVSAYVGDGANRWPAVHTLDAARLYRLALESATPGSRLHAVADPGIPFRLIAETIAAKLALPTTSIGAEATRRALRSARALRRPRQPDLQRADPGVARLAAHPPWPYRGPRPGPLLRGLAAAPGRRRDRRGAGADRSRRRAYQAVVRPRVPVFAVTGSSWPAPSRYHTTNPPWERSRSNGVSVGRCPVTAARMDARSTGANRDALGRVENEGL